MIKQYLVKEDNVSSCCNLVIWDFLITMLFVGTLSSNAFPELSMFQCIIIGVLGGILMLLLMAIPILKHVILFLYSLFWSFGVYDLLDEFIHISDYTPLWRYGIGLIIFLIVLVIHFASAADLEMFDSPSIHHFDQGNQGYQTNYANKTSYSSPTIKMEIGECNEKFKYALSLTEFADKNGLSDKYLPIKNFIRLNASKLVRQHNHLQRTLARYNKTLTESSTQRLASVIDDTLLMLDEYIDTLTAMLEDFAANSSADSEEYQQEQTGDAKQSSTSGNDSNSNYFKGCDTIEKLNKRYHDLIKIYHSDSGNGNDEVFIAITEEYNHLKSLFSKK